MSEITNTNPHSIVEAVIAAGDLSKLTPDQRNLYYVTVCQSIGLNPLTRPLEYILLNGKLTLYARKDATDQLRALRGISITRCDVSLSDPDNVMVTVEARDPSGRADIDFAVVSRKDMRGDFGNVVMKAVTKGKRRVTLSICGLGMLDETEVETIPDARPFAERPAPQQIERQPQSTQTPSRLVAETHDYISRAQKALEGNLPQHERDALVLGLDHAKAAVETKNHGAMQRACDELRGLVPGVIEAPKQDDSWKAEVVALGKRAVEAAKTATPEQVEVLSAAASMGREVLKRNGHSTAEERAAAISALKQALA